MTTLLLARHGMTGWNRAGRLQGRTDIALDADGRRDVAALAGAVAAWRPATVIASPLRRARETAELLTADLERVPPMLVDDRWIEHGLGEWEGCTTDDLPSAQYAAWRAGSLTPPGGEPPERTRARVAAALDDAISFDGPVLIATHGGTIRAALTTLLGLSEAVLVPVSPPSLTIVDCERGTTRLRHFNVTASASARG